MSNAHTVPIPSRGPFTRWSYHVWIQDDVPRVAKAAIRVQMDVSTVAWWTWSVRQWLLFRFARSSARQPVARSSMLPAIKTTTLARDYNITLVIRTHSTTSQYIYS
jgi:hypothetical protein